MRTLNTSNYALLYERKSLGYLTSLNEADAAKPAEESTISILLGDSEEVKAIKTLVIDNMKKGNDADPEFKKLNAVAAKLAAANVSGNESVTVKIGDKEYAVQVNALGITTAGGKQQVYVDYDSVSEVIAGLNIDNIVAEIYKGAENKGFLGIKFGTDEERLAAIAGAVNSYCYDKRVSPKPVFKAISERYFDKHKETLEEVIDGEFTGSPDLLAKALFGGSYSQDDVVTALGVDAAQSFLVDIAIAAATYAATAFTLGAAGGTAAASTSKLGMSIFNAGRAAGNMLRAGKTAQTASNVARTAAGSAELVKAGQAAASSTELANASAAATKFRTLRYMRGGQTFANAQQKAQQMQTATALFQDAVAGVKLAKTINVTAGEVKALRALPEFAQLSKYINVAKNGSAVINGETLAADLAAKSPGLLSSLKGMFASAPGAITSLLQSLGPFKSAVIVGTVFAVGDTIPDYVFPLIAEEGGEQGGEGYDLANTAQGVGAASGATFDDKAASDMADELYKLAEGGFMSYTDGGDELKIAFCMLSLVPETWAMVNSKWNDRYAEEGSLYDSVVDGELSGDLLAMVNGYLGGIAGVGPLAGAVKQIKAKLPNSSSKNTVTPVTETVQESRVFIKSFSQFRK